FAYLLYTYPIIPVPVLPVVPTFLPSIFFPLGPPFCGDECRAERALGCGGIFPCGQQAGARVRKRRREGNARAAQGTARVERRYTIQTCDPSVSRTAVRWAHNSLRVPRPDPPLLPSIIFPLGHARVFIST